MIKSFLFVGLGSLIGGMARYSISLLFHSRDTVSFPWGTFIVNLAGCFMIGFLYALAVKLNWSSPIKLFLTTGLMGGFTTFSAFSFETIQMMQQQHYAMAITYVLASVIIGMGLGFLGLSVLS